MEGHSITPTSSSSRGSYPSGQKRFGPAPLASFEDLPTDEQESSCEEDIVTTTTTTPHVPRSSMPPIPVISVIVTEPNQSVQSSRNVSPLHRSPCNDVREVLLSTPNKETKRKGSWTDIFSFRRSPSPTPVRERKFSLFNFKFFNKDDRCSDDQIKMEKLETRPLSANPSRDVLTKRISPDDDFITREIAIGQPFDDDFDQNDCHQEEQLTSERIEVKSPSIIETVVEVERFNATGEEDDQPTIVDSTSMHSGSSCSLGPECTLRRDSCCSSTMPPNSGQCYNCERIILNCPSDTDCCNIADNEDNDELTERNMVTDECELECLLKDDHLDSRNRLSVEPPIDSTHYSVVVEPTTEFSRKYFKSSGEMLKTSPIERPHSITPININSFEAYLQQSTLNTNSTSNNCDNKLTIKIPGFHSNYRSRKSNPYIWQEFCEKGLTSPQNLNNSRKRANSCFPKLSQGCYMNEAFESNFITSDKLTPITPIKDLNIEDRFDDNFWDSDDVTSHDQGGDSDKYDDDHHQQPNVRRTLKELNQENTTACNCDCYTTSLSVTSTNAHLVSLISSSEISSLSENSDNNHEQENVSLNEDQPLVSSIDCDCVCHLAAEQQSTQQTDHSVRPLCLAMMCNDDHDETLESQNMTEDEDLSQLTLSSSSSIAASTTSQSVHLFDTSATSNL